MRRIGVFICHCGLNIAGTVGVERVAKEIRNYPGVVYSVDYKYMCSDPGQDLIKGAIVEHDLDGVIVAACSPTMHEVTFRKTAATAGLNPYLCEIANIREQCAWVHQSQPEEATAKAIETIETIVEKVRHDESLVPLTLPLVKRALVIGGGIAGLQAALDIAEAGYAVILVEKESRLGGRMGQLSSIYLNFDAAPNLLASKIEAVTNHPNIQVITEAEVEEVAGYVGNFTVKVGKLVNWETGRLGDQSTNLQFTSLPLTTSALSWWPQAMISIPRRGWASTAAASILTSLMACSSSRCWLPMALRVDRFAVLRMGRSPGRSFGCSALAPATQSCISPTVPKSAVCMWPNRLSCTSARCLKARLTSFTLTSARLARATRSLCSRPWSSTMCSICAAKCRRSSQRMGK